MCNKRIIQTVKNPNTISRNLWESFRKSNNINIFKENRGVKYPDSEMLNFTVIIAKAGYFS